MLEYFAKMYVRFKTGIKSVDLDKVLGWVSDAEKLIKPVAEATGSTILQAYAGADKKAYVVSLIKQYIPSLNDKSINLLIEFCVSLLTK